MYIARWRLTAEPTLHRYEAAALRGCCAGFAAEAGPGPADAEAAAALVGELGQQLQVLVLAAFKCVWCFPQKVFREEGLIDGSA